MNSTRIAVLLALGAWHAGALADASATWRDGAQVYQKVCAHCHEAGVGPVIKGRNLPAVYIERVVRHGNRAMPSFRPSEIDNRALADVARLVSSAAVANVTPKD